MVGGGRALFLRVLLSQGPPPCHMEGQHLPVGGAIMQPRILSLPSPVRKNLLHQFLPHPPPTFAPGPGHLCSLRADKGIRTGLPVMTGFYLEP